MIDKAVPYIGIIMVKSDTKKYPVFKLPEGYEFVMYEDGFEKYWAELEFAVEEFDSYQKAFDYFKKEFVSRKELLQKRCIFVRKQSGEFAATASVWPGNTFGIEQDKIHWVCVHPNHQRKGLAKAILTKAMNIFAQVSSDTNTYLTTQTSSYKAINIYRKFGFRQYEGNKPINWVSQSTWEIDQLKAREIINKKIFEYEQKIVGKYDSGSKRYE